MKTAVITAYRGPKVLTIRDDVLPQPGPGDTLVTQRSDSITAQRSTTDINRRL